MVNCPNDKFVHQGLESFGEQRYVTAEMLRNFCRNDEYLYKMVEQLEYLTPPAVRKRFSPVCVDSTKSYGYSIFGSDVVFDDGGRNSFLIDFTDQSMVDNEMSTVDIHVVGSQDGVVKRAETPKIMENTIHREVGSSSPWNGQRFSCNEYWYIGFDKNREYHIQPNWLFEEDIGKGDDNGEIPSIGRAQTFTADRKGLLKGVTLSLKADLDKFNTASPFILQLRKVEMKNGVAYPAKYVYNGVLLAEEKVRFARSSPDITTITFTNPPMLERGKQYALCFLSPLSHPSNAFHIGGWSKSCGAESYAGGNAFFTQNNGASWILYGKPENVPYHQGRNAPHDFAFELQIQESREKYENNKWHYLYLKPFMANNIKQVEINSNDNSDNNNITIVYEISRNGRDWEELEYNQIRNCSPMWDMLFVRVKMKTTDENNPASVSLMRVSITTDPSSEMYVRSAYYFPKTDAMLGANVWGKVGAPFECEPTTACEVEIISDRIATEHFELIRVMDVKDYDWIESVADANLEGKSENKVVEILQSNKRIVDDLQKKGIYVLPYEKNDGWVYFFDRIKLINSPAYPILTCKLQPFNALTRNYGEWYDFIVNYGENVLEKQVDDGGILDVEIEKDNIYFYPDVLRNLVAGTLSIEYNPSYIKNLSNEEVGNGLVFDYFKESFIIDENNLESRVLPLRWCPVDPLRKVVLNPNKENVELIEDSDFVVDYDSKELEFIVNSNANLKVGDVISVVYTPSVEDIGLAVGYYATRSNTRKRCYIKPNYLEYKV